VASHVGALRMFWCRDQMGYVLILETKQVLHCQGTQWLMVVANVAVEEDSVFLECYTVLPGKWLPTFQRHHAALKYW
jgi:hypothetical protein